MGGIYARPHNIGDKRVGDIYVNLNHVVEIHSLYSKNGPARWSIDLSNGTTVAVSEQDAAQVIERLSEGVPVIEHLVEGSSAVREPPADTAPPSPSGPTKSARSADSKHTRAINSAVSVVVP